MANYNPTHRGGIVLHPKVRSTEILVWIVKNNRRDNENRIITTSRDVVEQFWPEDEKGRLAEASSRLLTLQKWGCLKVRVPNKGKEDRDTPYQRHKEYFVSDFGLKKAEEWKNGAPRWRKRQV